MEEFFKHDDVVADAKKHDDVEEFFEQVALVVIIVCGSCKRKI